MNRRIIARSIAAFAAVALALPAIAQSYPSKSVRLVLPFAPGSAVDVLARHYAQKMSENWKQQVVVDNRTGANGIIGMESTVAPAGPTGRRRRTFDRLRCSSKLSQSTRIGFRLASAVPVSSCPPLVRAEKSPRTAIRNRPLFFTTAGAPAARSEPMLSW